MPCDEIEELAYQCIAVGHDFVKAVEALKLPIDPTLQLSYRCLLARLKNGEILGKSDLIAAERVGDILREEMNAVSPGYGDRAFECFTDENVAFDRELELKRRAVVCLTRLTSENRILRDRSNARRWASSLGVGKK